MHYQDHPGFTDELTRSWPTTEQVLSLKLHLNATIAHVMAHVPCARIAARNSNQYGCCSASCCLSGGPGRTTTTRAVRARRRRPTRRMHARCLDLASLVLFTSASCRGPSCVAICITHIAYAFGACLLLLCRRSEHRFASCCMCAQLCYRLMSTVVWHHEHATLTFLHHWLRVIIEDIAHRRQLLHSQCRRCHPPPIRMAGFHSCDGAYECGCFSGSRHWLIYRPRATDAIACRACIVAACRRQTLPPLAFSV